MHIPGRKLAFSLFLLLLTSCGGESGPTQEAATRPTTVQISSRHFGMHIHDPAAHGWPVVPIGFWRLWDSGVQWPHLEPSPGEWNFDRLDQQIAMAETQGADPVIVLGLTPAWASARPRETCNYAPGNCAEPANISDWQNYVFQVATRYKGRVHYYELWNEPSLKSYYTGSVESLLQLSQVAYNTLKEIDPTVTVLSPAPVVQKTGIAWLKEYLALGGGNYADVIAYHFYQFPGSPEDLVTYFAGVKDVLNSHGVNKPIWDTEMGWGPGQEFSSEQHMAAFVARTFLLHWAAGITHVAWYAWDNQDWSSLRFTRSDKATPTRAGIAFAQMQQWAATLNAVRCTVDFADTWVCQLTQFDGTTRYAVWNPHESFSFSIPSSWRVTTVERVGGETSPINNNGTIEIGISPVLLVP